MWLAGLSWIRCYSTMLMAIRSRERPSRSSLTGCRLNDWSQSLAEVRSGDFTVSQQGSIAAAIVTGPEVRPFAVASICAAYEKPHRSTGKMSWNIVDASVHRIITGLSLLIGKQEGHRIVAAGDLTVWYGHADNKYWRRRNASVFDRMEASMCPSADRPIRAHPHDGFTSPEVNYRFLVATLEDSLQGGNYLARPTGLFDSSWVRIWT